MSATEDDVEFTVSIENGETLLDLEGDRDAAVIVRSASGERIYLPPKGFDRPRDDDSPYQSARDDSPYQSAREDSPYQGVRDDSPYQSAPDDSPYQSARQRTPRVGMVQTANGFRIRHPEPATEVRLLR